MIGHFKAIRCWEMDYQLLRPGPHNLTITMMLGRGAGWLIGAHTVAHVLSCSQHCPAALLEVVCRFALQTVLNHTLVF